MPSPTAWPFKVRSTTLEVLICPVRSALIVTTPPQVVSKLPATAVADRLEISHCRFVQFWKLGNPAIVGEADTALYDFWGTDFYPQNYADASAVMKPIVDYAASLKVPALIGEIGVPITDPAKQEAWCKKARPWFLANIRWGMYWSSEVGTDGTDFRLTDASAKAWFGLP